MRTTNLFVTEAGTVTHFEFDNGYGASLIANNDGYREIAVLDSEGELCYDTPITDDVLTHLTHTEVFDTLIAIHNLERKN